MRRGWFLAPVVLIAFPLACNLVIGADGYRECDAAECVGYEASADVASDGMASDATSETSSACSFDPDGGVSTGCSGSTPACSHGTCVGIKSIGHGASSSHACAILTDGRVRCWGSNRDGELGNGIAGSNPRYTAEVVNLTDAVDVQTGNDFTCALRTNGEVWCWGLGDLDQIGTPNNSTATPTQVSLGASATAISVGNDGVCAITTNGVYCWGADSNSNLGCPNGAAPQSIGPTLLDPPLPWPALHMGVGENMSCFSGGDVNGGGVICYGDNTDGLGDGQFLAPATCLQSNPAVQDGVDSPIPPLDQVWGSDDFTCGIYLAGSRVWCWGLDTNAQVTGSYPDSSVIWDVFATLAPVTISEGSLIAVTPGRVHTCAVVNKNNIKQLYCWGSSNHEQLGGYPGPDPGLIKLSFPPVDVAAHSDFSCLLDTSGAVLCWGLGGVLAANVQYYPLGNGDKNDNKTPLPVSF